MERFLKRKDHPLDDDEPSSKKATKSLSVRKPSKININLKSSLAIESIGINSTGTKDEKGDETLDLSPSTFSASDSPPPAYKAKTSEDGQKTEEQKEGTKGNELE